MKKVALTGATSMLGLAFIEQCILNKIKVIAFVRPDSSRLFRLPNSDLITIVNCSLDKLSDLNSENELYDTEVFYHFGWSHTDKHGRLDCYNQLQNIQFTIDAVRLAKKIGCKKFIGAGSQAEYGRTITRISCTTPVNPENAYGISKYAAGKLAEIECKKFGLEYVWVRIVSMYGINDLEHTLITDFITHCKGNRHLPLGPCNHIWDYLFEDDAGKAFYAIGKKGVNGKVYCLGSGTGRKLKEYLEEIRNLVNPLYNLHYGEIPYSDHSLSYLCADISELTQDTGWQPEIPFEEGIKKIIASSFI